MGKLLDFHENVSKSGPKWVQDGSKISKNVKNGQKRHFGQKAASFTVSFRKSDSFDSSRRVQKSVENGKIMKNSDFHGFCHFRQNGQKPLGLDRVFAKGFTALWPKTTV